MHLTGFDRSPERLLLYKGNECKEKFCKLETKTAEFCSTAENLKGTLEQMGHQMKNVIEEIDSLRESIQDEGQ